MGAITRISDVTYWQCKQYADESMPTPVLVLSRPIPEDLRCWGNINFGKQSYLTRGKQNITWLLTTPYICSGHQIMRNAPVCTYDVTPNLSIEPNQINVIRNLISAEIYYRKLNPKYLFGQTSLTTEDTIIYSTPINDLPNLPVGSPANRDVNEKTIVYGDLFRILEEYIKSADKEIDTRGTGPSNLSINLSVTTNNLLSAATINMLSTIASETMKDCICYSDCNEYSVCWCYGNCNNY